MTGRVYYNKLIRDNIPEKIANLHEECEVREITDEQEFEQELLKKVVEEAQGVAKASSRGELLGELADLYAVLQELKSFHTIGEQEFAVIRTKNLEKKGGFTRRLFLHWSSDSGYKSNETPQGTTTT